MHNLRWLGMTLLLLQATAEAHLLKLFAYVEGNTIHGSTYFAGGAAVAGATITITSATDKVENNLKSDAKGEFSFTIRSPTDYRIVANTGDGHQAEWLIKTDTFTPTPDNRDNALPPSPPSASSTSGQTEQQFAQLVEQAVAKQIGPLRESLQRNSDRARFSDILGGIGFIFGLAGVALWWRSKQHSGNK